MAALSAKGHSPQSPENHSLPASQVENKRERSRRDGWPARWLPGLPVRAGQS
jgi:hypothetical protein